MSVKITKEKILDIAFEIVRTNGIENLSNRTIAKELNSSIRPIYYQFKNTDGLKKELYNKIKKYFFTYIFDKSVEDSYKQVGINYIRFAKEESNLFKSLFFNNYIPSDFLLESDDEFKEISNLIRMKSNVKNIMDFHVEMWIFTHGLATLVACNNMYFSDEDVSNLLTMEFKALSSLNKKEGNDK